MRKLVKVLLFMALMTVTLTGCGNDNVTSDGELSKKTEILMKESNRQTGLPAMINWQEKKNLKRIYELCDQENLICYAYLVNEMNGKIGQYLGKCIGYGIPYSTQFSNPEKIIEADKYVGYNTPGIGPLRKIAQPEPNGLFKPEGLSATWLMMVDPETKKIRPIYVEPSIIVSPFKLHNKK